ncbi:MAG: cbb3-type cytochrome oxidase assembly protein CcoS [Deltaproteobacteria bacterium]|nr:cbb3-type cytochrome oxidase assembly protein CcoS [Deltaproteobacteria bacterium]
MNMIFFMLPIALLLSASGVIAYLWCSSHDQYNDLETPAHRMLLEDEIKK